MELTTYEIEKMILDHIRKIDDDTAFIRGNMNFSYNSYAEMYKAKSLALQALAELKR